jgi:hypothetical protein
MAAASSKDALSVKISKSAGLFVIIRKMEEGVDSHNNGYAVLLLCLYTSTYTKEEE